MRNIKVIKAMRLSLLVAMLSIGLNVTAQSLNSDAILVRDKSPEQFEKINFLVNEDYADLYFIMINKQCSSLIKYLRMDLTTEQYQLIVPYYEMSTKVINGVKCTDWALLCIFIDEKLKQ